MEPIQLDRNGLAALIDHTLLAPEAGPSEIDRLCGEASMWGFASVCVNPVWVSLAAEFLEGRSPLICSVVGFPLGATTTKAIEASRALHDGAHEIDMVMSVGHLKAGAPATVEAQIRDVVNAASGADVKVILETFLLTDSEKREACLIAENAGARWVKTSTGFSSCGATVHDVRLMVDAVRGRLGVKASGGIRTPSDVIAMLMAGATRLGCSRSVEIMNSWGRE
jgi:deoxyribose-phosphate aldolase